MRKKILAGLLATILLLLCFGCGKENKANLSADSKIAIIVGPKEDSPEAYSMAIALRAQNPDTVQVLTPANDYYTNLEALADLAVSTAQDPTLKAILFADGFAGTAAAVQKARAVRDDLGIVVCNPDEDASVIAKTANLVLDLDNDAYASAVVDQAKAFGVENFVFFSNKRSLRNDRIKGLYNSLQSACTTAKINVDPTTCADLYMDGKTVDEGKLLIAEAGTRKAEKYGEKTALFCTDALMQGAVAKSVADHALYMPATYLPSPISIAADLGVDLTDHETDSAYAMEQLKAKATELGIAGHVATWSFSEPIAVLQTAFQYACDVAKGNGITCTAEDINAYMQSAVGDASFTITQDDGGTYRIESTLVTL